MVKRVRCARDRLLAEALPASYLLPQSSDWKSGRIGMRDLERVVYDGLRDGVPTLPLVWTRGVRSNDRDAGDLPEAVRCAPRT